ncbi:MAG: Veg family protein [Clostridia bacterium]|nr:Veg family protein [Clostridia bacterium]
MIKQKNTYNAVVSATRALLGAPVDVSVSLGRNRFVSFKGIVSACYPSLFTVSPTDGFSGKTSYSYSEVMCGNVSVRKAGS